jgi:quercetin dioxygenase-like cupin family protein
MRKATPEIADLIYKQEAHDLTLPQAPVSTGHRFAPGVYLRSVFMPAGSRVIGHEHTTTHFNIVLSGRCQVIDGDKVVDIVAPYVFVSEAGTKKILNIIEDTIWATVHPTDETDIPTLESTLVKKSQAYLEHHSLPCLISQQLL